MDHLFDHWHPVLLARELGERPVRVQLQGHALAVFRTADGRVGALDDVCIHRRMALSEGHVEGERLICPYHGWSYERGGQAFSPGTPPIKACAPHWEVVERHGAIWLRRPLAGTAFPRVPEAGYRLAGTFRHRIGAPLLVVLDNFTEVEHTATTHALFGYPLEAMEDVQVTVERDDESVRVVNRGRQKPTPGWVRTLFGIGADDDFVDDWTTRFSPVHTTYDQYWVAPDSGEPRPDRLRVVVFFNPIDAQTTDLVTFVFGRVVSWRRFGLPHLLDAVLRRFALREIELDVSMLERLADTNPDLRGMTLGRFDRALRENRRLYRRIYLGEADPG